MCSTWEQAHVITWDEYLYMTIQKISCNSSEIWPRQTIRKTCLLWEFQSSKKQKIPCYGLEQTLTLPRSTLWTLLVIPGSSSPAYMDSSQQGILWTWWTNISQSQSQRRRWDWVISWNPFQTCIFWLLSHSKQKHKWSSQPAAGLMANFCSLQLHHS